MLRHAGNGGTADHTRLGWFAVMQRWAARARANVAARRYIKILTRQQKILIVDADAMCRCAVVRSMVEAGQLEVPLVRWGTAVVDRLVAYCVFHHEAELLQYSPVVVRSWECRLLASTSDEILAELVLAADSLELDALLDLTSKEAALRSVGAAMPRGCNGPSVRSYGRALDAASPLDEGAAMHRALPPQWELEARNRFGPDADEALNRLVAEVNEFCAQINASQMPTRVLEPRARPLPLSARTSGFESQHGLRPPPLLRRDALSNLTLAGPPPLRRDALSSSFNVFASSGQTPPNDRYRRDSLSSVSPPALARTDCSFVHPLYSLP